VVCPMNLDDIREILCNKHTRARALMDMPHVFFSRSRLRSALCG
jgi:hypothetical protein